MITERTALHSSVGSSISRARDPAVRPRWLARSTDRVEEFTLTIRSWETYFHAPKPAIDDSQPRIVAASARDRATSKGRTGREIDRHRSVAPASFSDSGRRLDGQSGPKQRVPARIPESSSAVDESQLEKSILRRGLATAAEIEACKSQRKQLAAKESDVAQEPAGDHGRGQGPDPQPDDAAACRKPARPTRKFQIPGYQMIQKLGKGSMGVVYKAKQLSVDRVVAIKILLDPLAQNKEFIKRFEREAMIAAKLSHNNVVNAIDAGEIDGHYYFVMEYVEGPTIKDYLDKNKTFDEKEALRITLAIAEASSTRPSGA